MKLSDSQIEKNDIIQITDTNHPWFPALLIVDEVKSWGVQAGCIIPKNNEVPGSTEMAFNRLTFGTFQKVGSAVIIEKLTDDPPVSHSELNYE